MTKVGPVERPGHTPPGSGTPHDEPFARSAVQPTTFRRLAAAAYAVPDGRQHLLDVLRRLASAERPPGAPPPLTEEQLRWVLDQLEQEALA